MRALFRALFAPRDPELRAQLDAFRDATLDGDTQIKPPRVVYAEPERDETKPSCVHCYGDGDVIALELQRERIEARQPKVRRMPIREVK